MHAAFWYIMRELFIFLSGLLSMAMSVANMHHCEIIEEHGITIHLLMSYDYP